MALIDPIAAYVAESNIEALLVQRILEDEGIEAFVTEDHSLVGYWKFGILPEIHDPRVWISRRDAEHVTELLAEYERRKIARNVDRRIGDTRAIEVHCDDCGKTSTFAGRLAGTVQDCPHCGSYVDVGEFEWPYDVGDAADTNADR